MSDEADKGNEAAELFLRAALSKRQRAPGGDAIGTCLNCGALCDAPARFCDIECRDDYDRYAR